MAQQPIDKDQVRMLVADVGYTEASNQLNIKRDTLYKWGQRKGWKQPVLHAQERTVQSVQSPADAHAAILAERKAESATHLSRYIVDASKRLADSNGELKHARPARDIVAARSGVWPEERQGETGLTLNLLNLVMPAESMRSSAHEDE